MEFIKILTAIPVIQVFILQIMNLFCYIFGFERNYYIASLLQQIIAVFVPTYYFYELRKNIPYLQKKDFDINNIGEPKKLVFFVILGLSLQMTASLINFPVILLFKSMGFEPISDIPVKGGFDFFASIISVCLLPAIFEEVLFRKFVFNDLRMFSKNTAILFSALFFAISHMSFYSFGAVLIMGIVFGILRTKEYPLVCLMICHFFTNFSVIIITMLSENPFFDKYYYFFAFLSVAAAVYAFLKLFNKPEQLEFNYYEKPMLQFINTARGIPYIYPYIIIFILLGIKNLF